AAILELIKKKQSLLRDAWLTETGHKRPGVKAGLPIQDAEKQAAELDRQARELARQTAVPGTAGQAPFPGQVSDWNGYVKHEFVVDGREVLVVVPKSPA